MKKITIIFTLFLAGIALHAQDISGTWMGVLPVGETGLRVNFNISKTADGYTATLDSPDQNAYGIAVTKVEFKNPDVSITVTNLTIVYKGKLVKEDLIEGTFTQSGQSFEMNMTRKKEE